MRSAWRVIAIASVAPLAWPVGAGSTEPEITAPAPRLPPCTCRYQGADLPLGSRRCLPTPEGPRMAECVIELNVTSWRKSEEHCPDAFRRAPRA